MFPHGNLHLIPEDIQFKSAMQVGMMQLEGAIENLSRMIGAGLMSGKSLEEVRETLVTVYNQMIRDCMIESRRATLYPGEWALADAIKRLDALIARH